MRKDAGRGGVAEKYYRPVFRKVPQDQEVQESKMCRFDSIVSGRPPPELLWFRDGTEVSSFCQVFYILIL